MSFAFLFTTQHFVLGYLLDLALISPIKQILLLKYLIFFIQWKTNRPSKIYICLIYREADTSETTFIENFMLDSFTNLDLSEYICIVFVDMHQHCDYIREETLTLRIHPLIVGPQESKLNRNILELE